MPRPKKDPNAPVKPRKVLTAAEIEAKIKAAENLLASLKAKKYESTLDVEVAGLRIPELFAKLNTATGADPLTILAAIGKAAKIPRLQVTQKPVVPRKTEPKAE